MTDSLSPKKAALKYGSIMSDATILDEKIKHK